MRLGWLLVLAWLSVACVPQAYHQTEPGRFEGELRLRWLAPDMFVYEPNPAAPFRFVRPNGQVVEPGPLVTDGGSAPRSLWGIEGLSPWGYAPAFVVHDWLFQRYRCGLTAGGDAAFDESVSVMAETLRTLMGDAPSERDLERFRAIVAVSAGPVARFHWNHSECRSVAEPW